MKKEFFLITGILVFSVFEIFGQTPGPKWEKVFEATNQIIYVDTSSIKQFENQISVLSVTYYKTPLMITSLNKEAASIKSQLLFNAASKKFTVIGTLYYDKSLKILGETSLPGFASSSETFSVSIEGNEAMMAVFNKAVNYLKSGLAIIEQKVFSKSGEKNKELLTADQTKKAKAELPKPAIRDTTKAVDRVALYLNKRDSVQRTSIESAKSKPIPTSTSQPDPKKRKEVKQPTIAEKKKPVVDTKNIESESGINLKSTIFKEGKKYSFQVSSWKNKSKAESEVIRLKGEGHTALLAEGIVNGQTWYRVRIGYFNSLEETEQYMKKVKTK